MEHIPVAGWAVIGFIATLAFIAIMRLAKKGVDLSVGDKKLSIGKTIDEKFSTLQSDIEKKEKQRLTDEELRKKLFRRSGEIDEKTKADERRTIRKLNAQIQALFEPYIHCTMPAGAVIELIKDVFEERVDYNCMRERLTRKERAGYIADILYFIETDYRSFLQKIPAVPCHDEKYPAWEEIRPKVVLLAEKWADEIISIITKRCQEKIEMYAAEQETFQLEEYKQLCIDFPIEKNKKYIAELRG